MDDNTWVEKKANMQFPIFFPRVEAISKKAHFGAREQDTMLTMNKHIKSCTLLPKNSTLTPTLPNEKLKSRWKRE